MGQSTFPVPSTGSSTSTVLPVNASSVILDGSLTSAGTYTTTINGNGGIAYLTATDNAATITVGGTAYSVPANTVVATTAVVGSGVSTTVAAATIPSTFSASTMPSSQSWRSVAYGVISSTNYYVAVATSTTSGAYSTNGTSWTASTMPSASAWQSLTFGNGRFVAIAFNQSNAAYSTNGTTWTASTLSTTDYWTSVAYGLIGATNYYVAVQESGTSTNNAYSTNGSTWTTGTMPVSGSAFGYNSITFGNGFFVAAPSGSTIGAYSSNGLTWTANTFSSSITAFGLTYGNGYYVAVGFSSAIGAYGTPSPILPVNFGIYNGPTTIN